MQKILNIWLICFCKGNCGQNLSKIARSGHTAAVVGHGNNKSRFRQFLKFLKFSWTLFRVSRGHKFRSESVLPYLAKFGHFGNILKFLGDYVRVYSLLSKNWTCFGQHFMPSGKLSLLHRGIKLTNNLAIWSHWSSSSCCVIEKETPFLSVFEIGFQCFLSCFSIVLNGQKSERDVAKYRKRKYKHWFGALKILLFLRDILATRFSQNIAQIFGWLLKNGTFKIKTSVAF